MKNEQEIRDKLKFVKRRIDNREQSDHPTEHLLVQRNTLKWVLEE